MKQLRHFDGTGKTSDRKSFSIARSVTPLILVTMAGTLR